jgi:hypothetical protein
LFQNTFGCSTGGKAGIIILLIVGALLLLFIIMGIISVGRNKWNWTMKNFFCWLPGVTCDGPANGAANNRQPDYEHREFDGAHNAPSFKGGQ